MPLLPAILSVLAVWALLGVLIFGLLLIIKALQSIRGWLEKITMGVRAIDKQTAPLAAHAAALAASLGEAGDSLGAGARRLADVERGLDAAAPALRAR
jgi:hypothetical protein